MPELFQVVTVAQALERLLPRLAPLGRAEPLGLLDALDRVTARELRAPVDLPAFARSTMDGFAVRAADTYGASEGLPAYLALCGEVPMGRAADVTIGLGQAAQVHTGDPLPPGTDAVVMAEHVQEIGDEIEIMAGVVPWQHVRPLGEDIVATELVLPENHRIRPVDLGALVAAGHAVPRRHWESDLLAPLLAALASPRFRRRSQHSAAMICGILGG